MFFLKIKIVFLEFIELVIVNFNFFIFFVMYDSCSYKALVCHDISDVVTYSSKKNLVWLIDESPRTQIYWKYIGFNQV